MSERTRTPSKRRQHCINVYVTHRLKGDLTRLARKYDRTTADVVRTLITIGIPLMDGLSKAERIVIKEYVHMSRRFRQMKALKDI